MGFILLILACILTWWGINAVQQQFRHTTNTHITALENTIVDSISLSISNTLTRLQTKVAATASDTDLATVFRVPSGAYLAGKQNIIRQQYPEAMAVCLLPKELDAPDPTGCVPINFATLALIRQAKSSPEMTPVAINNLGRARGIVLTHQILDQNNTIQGVLLVAFEAKIITSLLPDISDKTGYLALHQGIGWEKLALTFRGDTTLSDGDATYVQEIPNSLWEIKFWSANQVERGTWLWLWVLLGFVIVWLWREGWIRTLLRLESEVLSQQLGDMQQGELRREYDIFSPSMSRVSTDITALATLMRRSETGQQASMPPPDLDLPSITEILPKQDTPLPAAKENNDLEHEHIEFISSPKETAKSNLEITSTIFREYDIRGVVDDTLTVAVMTEIGAAIGRYLRTKSQTTISVGRDGRLSSPALAEALIAGVLMSGIDVVDAGEVPTPVLYYTALAESAGCGLMVTGSHNPSTYNGLKMIVEGETLSGKDILQWMQTEEEAREVAAAGTCTQSEMVTSYLHSLIAVLDVSRSLRVAVDAGNGVAGPMVVSLLETLGCDVIPLFCDVDGRFPNHHPNPSDPDNLLDLIAAVKTHKADIGLAFDGDGDRLGVVDELGNIIWADKQLALYAQEVLAQHPNKNIIYDVKSSPYLATAIRDAGGEPIMVASGYTHIRRAMIRHNAPLGGELSGHIFFREDWNGFDDALYTAGRLLMILAATDLPASSLFSALPSPAMSTAELVVPMAEGEPEAVMQQFVAQAEFLDADISTIDGLRAEFVDGWGLVRASHTSPSLVMRFEADNAVAMSRITALFKQKLRAISPTLQLPI